MGGHATADKGSASGSVAKRAATPMTQAEHTGLVDLLFQQSAQSARAALAQGDSKDMIHAAGVAIGKAMAAVAANDIPETAATAPKQLFTSVDASFMGLYDLYNKLDASSDAGITSYKASVQAAMISINDRFGKLGWKVPKTADEGAVRARAASKAGAATLTTTEKGRLGLLHMQAARQHLLGNWELIQAGKLGTVKTVASNLHEAAMLLLDPRLSGARDSVESELAAMEHVYEMLVATLEQRDPDKVGELKDLAAQLDSLLRVVGKPPHWAQRFATKAPAPTTTTTPAPAAPGPTAEPAQHAPVETRLWKKKVWIKDTNYTDELLGHIELTFEAYKTASGQIYVSTAKAVKRLEGRAGEYLSMGADIHSSSVSLEGQHYCDLWFDIHIGGPNKTESQGVEIGGKVSAGKSGGGKESGAEIGASATFSTAVTSQGTRNFRRVYRINGLGAKLAQMDVTDGRAKMIQSGMTQTTRQDLHQDFDDFELDDDDVGDGWGTFYANWVLHSYGGE